MVPDAGELLFSIIFSYMGALEFFFIARNLYHWGFKHHKHMVELAEDENSLTELQENIKAAIKEAKAKEVYGYSAMKDGVLYKDGFRVSPDSESAAADTRHVIGSSRNSIEEKDESINSNIEGSQQKKSVTESSSRKQNAHGISVQISDQQEQQQQEVIEEPFVKKHVEHEVSTSYQEEKQRTAADDERTNLTQTIKTQIGQTDSEQYSLKSEASEAIRSDQSPTRYDESLSTESPTSAQRSGFSNQESTLETPASIPDMHFDEYERPEPDGQDVNEPHYSDDYLRSLDGIKFRPLVRDDGTGRRRAFKKRRSSGDSTSSRESRASREEEVKMFTSLEEEEFEAIKRGETEYTPIRYSSDPNLKVGKHNRRHKRSPVKGSKESEESRSSLDMLDEESGSPWGDVKPEHYKDMEYWKREKATSIEEETEDNTKGYVERGEEEQSPTADELIERCASPSSARNVPKMSSFEEATHLQHENAISTLKRSLSRDIVSKHSKLMRFRCCCINNTSSQN